MAEFDAGVPILLRRTRPDELDAGLEPIPNYRPDSGMGQRVPIPNYRPDSGMGERVLMRGMDAGVDAGAPRAAPRDAGDVVDAAQKVRAIFDAGVDAGARAASDAGAPRAPAASSTHYLDVVDSSGGTQRFVGSSVADVRRQFDEMERRERTYGRGLPEISGGSDEALDTVVGPQFRQQKAGARGGVRMTARPYVYEPEPPPKEEAAPAPRVYLPNPPPKEADLDIESGGATATEAVNEQARRGGDAARALAAARARRAALAEQPVAPEPAPAPKLAALTDAGVPDVGLKAPPPRDAGTSGRDAGMSVTVRNEKTGDESTHRSGSPTEAQQWARGVMQDGGAYSVWGDPYLASEVAKDARTVNARSALATPLKPREAGTVGGDEHARETLKRLTDARAATAPRSELDGGVRAATQALTDAGVAEAEGRPSQGGKALAEVLDAGRAPAPYTRAVTDAGARADTAKTVRDTAPAPAPKVELGDLAGTLNKALGIWDDKRAERERMRDAGVDEYLQKPREYAPGEELSTDVGGSVTKALKGFDQSVAGRAAEAAAEATNKDLLPPDQESGAPVLDLSTEGVPDQESGAPLELERATKPPKGKKGKGKKDTLADKAARAAEVARDAGAVPKKEPNFKGVISDITGDITYPADMDAGAPKTPGEGFTEYKRNPEPGEDLDAGVPPAAGVAAGPTNKLPDKKEQKPLDTGLAATSQTPGAAAQKDIIDTQKKVGEKKAEGAAAAAEGQAQVAGETKKLADKVAEKEKRLNELVGEGRGEARETLNKMKRLSDLITNAEHGKPRRDILHIIMSILAAMAAAKGGAGGAVAAKLLMGMVPTATNRWADHLAADKDEYERLSDLYGLQTRGQATEIEQEAMLSSAAIGSSRAALEYVKANSDSEIMRARAGEALAQLDLLHKMQGYDLAYKQEEEKLWTDPIEKLIAANANNQLTKQGQQILAQRIELEQKPRKTEADITRTEQENRFDEFRRFAEKLKVKISEEEYEALKEQRPHKLRELMERVRLTAANALKAENDNRFGPKPTETEMRYDILINNGIQAYERVKKYLQGFVDENGNEVKGRIPPRTALAFGETVSKLSETDEQMRRDVELLLALIVRAESGAAMPPQELDSRANALGINAVDDEVRADGLQQLILGFEGMDRLGTLRRIKWEEEPPSSIEERIFASEEQKKEQAKKDGITYTLEENPVSKAIRVHEAREKKARQHQEALWREGRLDETTIYNKYGQPTKIDAMNSPDRLLDALRQPGYYLVRPSDALIRHSLETEAAQKQREADQRRRDAAKQGQ